MNEIIASPVGRWIAFDSVIWWCRSPTLCGVIAWGRPHADETRALLSIFDQYHRLASRFDIVTDASAVEGLDRDALALLLAWARAHRTVFRDHIRARVAVLPAGVDGLALAGISPSLALEAPIALFHDAREAYRAVERDAYAEVSGIIESCRSAPPILVRLRGALVDASGAIDLVEAARRIGVSTRSLQRALTSSGSSFRHEQREARYRVGEQLLAGSEAKLAAIARRVGLTEEGFAQLVLARAGCTPGELRRRLRSG